MNNIIKKWWFWAIIGVVVLSVFSLFSNDDKEINTEISSTPSVTEQSTPSESTTLPSPSTISPTVNSSAETTVLINDEYNGQESLVVFKQFQENGLNVTAEFDNPALTDINGSATDVLNSTNLEVQDERLSVDAFVVKYIEVDGNNVNIIVTLVPKDY